MAHPQSFLFCFFISCFLLLVGSNSTDQQVSQVYIVYMGSSSLSGGGEHDYSRAKFAPVQLLSTILSSEEMERVSLIHHYNHAFLGFSAMLTQDEASILSGHREVVSIFRDPVLPLHTTRSWDFLDDLSNLRPSDKESHGASDVIIGIIDTGIWPESPSFDDEGIGDVPPRWKGTCMEGIDFKKQSCNRKLIGARFYATAARDSNRDDGQWEKLTGSPRDHVGHGTHTASIAAGARVANASYHNLAQGTARGGSPSTRIAMYKACTFNGCSGSSILKAIDDAISDGVDVISISIGASSIIGSDYLSDPIAIGAFHASQMGVMVICSAGNEGPAPSTVVNSSPWIFTVGASSIDRDFQSSILTGSGKAFQGSAINFSNLTDSKTYPLVFGVNATSNLSLASRNCYPGSLQRKEVAGKIVVCTENGFGISRQVQKLVAENAGAKGLILVDGENKWLVPLDSGAFPLAEVGGVAATELLKYINGASENGSATILPTVEIHHHKPAPTVAYFSSRGPGSLTENILKPDIIAPGVAVLAAMVPKVEAEGVPVGNKPSGYAIKSGTSMACPHVTGAIAFIKSVRPKWSFSMIKSALITTATTHNNMGMPITNSAGSMANPHEMGAGEISPMAALNPGLVFKTTAEDDLNFLCYFGYPEKKVKLMSNRVTFRCPTISSTELISSINYPSISIGRLDMHGGADIIKRTVTNMGPGNSSYTAHVHAPVGLIINVSPKKMVFAKRLGRMSFNVSFRAKNAPSGYNFGSISWLSDHRLVRLVFAVNVD